VPTRRNRDQHFKSFRDSQSLHERLPLSRIVLAMRVKSPFSKCFVWIRRSIHDVRLSVGLFGRNYSSRDRTTISQRNNSTCSFGNADVTEMRAAWDPRTSDFRLPTSDI
jgi:hypothetical protein